MKCNSYCRYYNIYIYTQCNWYEKYVETCCISNDSIGTFFPVPPSFPS